MPFDEFDQIRRKFGKIGQGFVNHDRFGGRSSGGGPPRRTLGRNAFALHQQDRLVVFATQHRVVAFDEHDSASIGSDGGKDKINNAVLETTLWKLKIRTNTVDFA